MIVIHKITTQLLYNNVLQSSHKFIKLPESNQKAKSWMPCHMYCVSNHRELSANSRVIVFINNSGELYCSENWLNLMPWRIYFNWGNKSKSPRTLSREYRVCSKTFQCHLLNTTFLHMVTGIVLPSLKVNNIAKYWMFSPNENSPQETHEFGRRTSWG